jgi:hypothetical protein
MPLFTFANYCVRKCEEEFCMIVYHATKTKAAFKTIKATGVLLPGYNVTTGEQLVHLCRKPFVPGSWALDVIGADTNEAWVFTLEIPDDTPLREDPSKDGETYNGGWVVHEGELHTSILSVEHIKDVRRYEMGMT